jgi:hypothetical protein
MASAHYNLALQEWFKGTIGDITSPTNTIKARLMRTAVYTFSQAHQWASQLPAPIVPDVVLGNKVANGNQPSGGTDPGCFDAADAVFPAVPGGALIDCLAVFKDTGNPATSNLLFYLDGFQVTPNGGDITVQWQNAAPWIARL